MKKDQDAQADRTSAFERERVLRLLEDLPAWRYDENRSALFRHITFDDFAEAFSFMTRVAITADRLDHHPEWANVYNKLDIWLTTHDARGVTRLDFALAELIESILPPAKASRS